jgi:hypothetical protein
VPLNGLSVSELSIISTVGVCISSIRITITLGGIYAASFATGNKQLTLDLSVATRDRNAESEAAKRIRGGFGINRALELLEVFADEATDGGLKHGAKACAADSPPSCLSNAPSVRSSGCPQDMVAVD